MISVRLDHHSGVGRGHGLHRGGMNSDGRHYEPRHDHTFEVVRLPACGSLEAVERQLEIWSDLFDAGDPVDEHFRDGKRLDKRQAGYLHGNSPSVGIAQSVAGNIAQTSNYYTQSRCNRRDGYASVNPRAAA